MSWNRVLELSGTTVTINAMDCQKNIAAQIVEQTAGYILAVKENQPSLLADIKDSFQMLEPASVAEPIDCGHGRVERDDVARQNSARGGKLRRLWRIYSRGIQGSLSGLLRTRPIWSLL